MTLRTGVTVSLAVGASAFGPTVQELQTACVGVGPGRPKDDCTLKRMQDTNAKATHCFQHDSSEPNFRSCTAEFCGRQSDVCSGPGGPDVCKHQCMEYGFSQYENLKALQGLPGAKWEVATSTSAPQVVALHSMPVHSDSHLAPTLSLAVIASAFGPTVQELQTACVGVGPGRPKDDCTLKRMQDTNAKATHCFQHDSSEATFRSCTTEFCGRQADVCSGPGGPDVCKHQCMEYGFSQYENLKALQGLPGAKWEVATSTTAPQVVALHSEAERGSKAPVQFHMKLHAQNHSATNLQPQAGKQPQKVAPQKSQKSMSEKSLPQSAEKAKPVLSLHHATKEHSLTVPSSNDLLTACAGVGAGNANDKCSTMMMRDTNAKATQCYTENPTNERSYRGCCDSFCSVSGEACTGHKGEYVCSHQCTEFAYSQYINLKALSSLPGATQHSLIAHHATVNRSEAIATSLAQHKVALRGRRFMATPTLDELNAGCAGVAPGLPKVACTTLRKRFTNGKARECFTTTETERKYQSCCTGFCHTESESCTGNGGKAMCFTQCIEDSHPLFTNLKALSGVPGALKAIEPVTSNQTEPAVRLLSHKSAKHTTIEHKEKKAPAAKRSHSHMQPSHDAADVAREHSYRSSRSLGSGQKA